MQLFGRSLHFAGGVQLFGRCAVTGPVLLLGGGLTLGCAPARKNGGKFQSGWYILISVTAVPVAALGDLNRPSGSYR